MIMVSEVVVKITSWSVLTLNSWRLSGQRNLSRCCADIVGSLRNLRGRLAKRVMRMMVMIRTRTMARTSLYPV